MGRARSGPTTRRAGALRAQGSTTEGRNESSGSPEAGNSSSPGGGGGTGPRDLGDSSSRTSMRRHRGASLARSWLKQLATPTWTAAQVGVIEMHVGRELPPSSRGRQLHRPCRHLHRSAGPAGGGTGEGDHVQRPGRARRGRLLPPPVPVPDSRLKTPGGKPTSSISSATTKGVSGATSDGLGPPRATGERAPSEDLARTAAQACSSRVMGLPTDRPPRFPAAR